MQPIWYEIKTAFQLGRPDWKAVCILALISHKGPAKNSLMEGI